MRASLAAAAVLLILSGCAVPPHGPDVSGSVAIGPHGIYAGNVSVGSNAYVAPAAPAPAFIFPAFPMPLIAYPPHPRILPLPPWHVLTDCRPLLSTHQGLMFPQYATTFSESILQGSPA